MERKLDLQSKIADPEMPGIDRSATMADIKKAYRVKLSGLHPDKVARMDPEIQELAKTRTVELREAMRRCWNNRRRIMGSAPIPAFLSSTAGTSHRR